AVCPLWVLEDFCALARKSSRTQSGQTALMPDLRQSIGLVHKLGKLAAAEEFLHRRHNGTDIDQRVGGSLPWLLNAHALFHHALHAQQTNAELRLDQLAHAAH